MLKTRCQKLERGAKSSTVTFCQTLKKKKLKTLVVSLKRLEISSRGLTLLTMEWTLVTLPWLVGMSGALTKVRELDDERPRDRPDTTHRHRREPVFFVDISSGSRECKTQECDPLVLVAAAVVAENAQCHIRHKPTRSPIHTSQHGYVCCSPLGQALPKMKKIFTLRPNERSILYLVIARTDR
jgi:hypothetical protein